MRILVLYSHPVETSFNASLHEAVVRTLKASGHDVDDCDLYAEGFEPALTRQERIDYHDPDRNRANVADYVRRLEWAEALVLCYPVWNFGFPAMLKGFLDRVFLPGVSFKMEGGKVVPSLHNITKMAAVTHYGGTRMRAFLAGDPPRKSVMRVLRAVIKPFAPVTYLALYDMNRATDEDRRTFLKKVEAKMTRF
ncbi:putative NADPH-quinone reductase [Breoghania corrubedonensis]|uniref:Putative NADPH-quinone reductase n=1 Tax=Breoghania corrubedonensis TaxID=665038 RepID=A0A2T5VHP3_9HYPH|nr:NAD(P)H-dependent oxidoreductase [Breoghania corrubedonensis]PTW63271.1 putative NADPH-quinone reductase [Breoghania corrubedonensis]